MPVNVNEAIAKLKPARRGQVERRAAELLAEEMTLRQLRRARGLTQARVAKALGTTQDGVSRLEKRADLLLSTLRATVRAMGGSLTMVAEFPDQAPVVVASLGEAGEARDGPAWAKRKRAQSAQPRRPRS